VIACAIRIGLIWHEFASHGKCGAGASPAKGLAAQEIIPQPWRSRLQAQQDS